MTPRMKSSKKWTAFPKEYSEQIETVFRDNFAAQLEGADLHVEGRIYPEEVLLRVGYHRKGELRQANFEVSMNYSREDQDAVERIHNCVDAAASMMMEYFEKEGEVDFPYAWKEYPFQNKKIFLQFSTVNSALEAEADRLLGVDAKNLVSDEEAESEDALIRAEELIQDGELVDEDEDEEEATPGPRMFGGPRKKKKDDLH